MPITKTAKNELYKILMGIENTDSKSQVLPKPSYAGNGDTNYINQFKTHVLDSTNESISKIISYENKEVVLIDYELSGSQENAFMIYETYDSFDEQGNFVETSTTFFIIDKQTNKGNPVLLPKIYDYKLTATGEIFGFSNGIEDDVKDKMHFFIFNDILPLINVLTDQEIQDESFFTAIVDVETEIKEEKDGTVKGGNAAFGLIRDSLNKYGFNQDEKDSETYGFVMWSHTTKKITVIRFQTNAVNIVPGDVSYELNGEISTSQGDNTATNFDDISIVDILTGDRDKNAILQEPTIGSLIVSTQKNAGSDQVVTIKTTLTDVGKSSYSTKFDSVSYASHTAITIDTPTFEKYLDRLRDIIASNPLNIDYELTINIKQPSYFNGQRGSLAATIPAIDMDIITVKKDVIDKMLADSGISMSTFLESPALAFDHATTTIFVGGPGGSYINVKTGIAKRARSGSLYKIVGWDHTVTLTMKVITEREQQVIAENSTSQIVIEKSGSDVIYKVIQAENNSFEGNPPVFENALKAFIPLKKNGEYGYSIFEFNGEESQNQQQSDRTLNKQGDRNYDDLNLDSYKTTLLEPISVRNINLNNIDIPASDYSLDGDVVTIKGVKDGYPIIISYVTLIGAPREMHVDTTSDGTDLFLTSVLDEKELGNITRAVVGAGDNSEIANNTPATKVFGFNLYKDNKSIDYNQIAEEYEKLNFKVKHVIASRQNNILFIKAFTEDYTKFLSWIQIYPDADSPYTKLPYANPEVYFALERLSINKDGDRSKTVFDKGFIDVPPSGDTLVAITTVKATDGNNQDNNKQILYGQTNKPIFEIDKPLIKTSSESITLNTNITTEVRDLINKDLLRPAISEKIALLFSKPHADTYKLIQLDKFVITYENGETVETSAFPFLRLDTDNELIRVEISLYNKDVGEANDKLPNKLELLNVAGDIFTTIDLSVDQCVGEFTNIGFDIVISNDKQPFFKWGETGWGDKPWAPLKALKGVI